MNTFKEDFTRIYRKAYMEAMSAPIQQAAVGDQRPTQEIARDDGTQQALSGETPVAVDTKDYAEIQKLIDAHVNLKDRIKAGPETEIKGDGKKPEKKPDEQQTEQPPALSGVNEDFNQEQELMQGKIPAATAQQGEAPQEQDVMPEPPQETEPEKAVDDGAKYTMYVSDDSIKHLQHPEAKPGEESADESGVDPDADIKAIIKTVISTKPTETKGRKVFWNGVETGTKVGTVKVGDEDKETTGASIEAFDIGKVGETHILSLVKFSPAEVEGKTEETEDADKKEEQAEQAGQTPEQQTQEPQIKQESCGMRSYLRRCQAVVSESINRPITPTQRTGVVEQKLDEGKVKELWMVANEIAKEFCTQLQDELGAAKVAKIARLNRTPKFQDGACATHDFCDANQVMLNAFEARGVAQPTDSKLGSTGWNKAIAIWEAAWNIARENDFNAESIEID